MTIDEVVAMVPEDKREAVKGELTGYVKIGSRDDAEKIANEHPHVKSVLDSRISKAVESHDVRFMAEKLPTLVEEEVRKRNPPKDPKDIELSKLRDEMEKMKREGTFKEQRALAVKLAAEKKLPIDIVERFIGENDEDTVAAIDKLAGVLMPWRDETVKAEIGARIGNNGTPPKGGDPDKKAALMADYNRLIKEGKREQANLVYLKLKDL